MKKLIAFVFVLVSLNNYAQSQQLSNVYSVGGEISYINTSRDFSNDFSYFYFTPELGYFFIENLYTAIKVSYIYQSSDNLSSSNYGIGPTIRYYFNADKLKPFLGFSLSLSKIESFYNYDYDISEFSFMGGVDYFITNYFAVESSINYSFMNQDFTSNDDSGKANIKELRIGIGAKYFIK